MSRNSWTRGARAALLVVSLVAWCWLFAPIRADAVGVAYCFLEHGEAGDEHETWTTVKYALAVSESRSEAREAARGRVKEAMQDDKYAGLEDKSVYEHGAAVRGPQCDTWAFQNPHWVLIRASFKYSSYEFDTVVAGVGTEEKKAMADAEKNLKLHNWAWTLSACSFQDRVVKEDSGEGVVPLIREWTKPDDEPVAVEATSCR